MKNNKTTTYILVLIVMGLWIVVFYRVYKSFFSKDNNSIVLKKEHGEKKVKMDKQETFTIKANYPDPFMGKVVSSVIQMNAHDAVNINKPITRVNKPKIEKPSVDWSFIKYIGLIKNQNSKKQVALVSINNREVMASEGDFIDNVLFVKNLKDSIKISYQGVSKYIKK